MANNAMGLAAELRLDDARLRAIEAELQGVKNGLPRAGAAAINATLRRGRTTAVNELAAILTAKRNNIFRRTRVDRATPARLSGRIAILARPIALPNFEAVDTRLRGRMKLGIAKGSGVFVRIFKGSEPDRFPRAFIANGLNNNRQVFQRVSRGGKRVGRLPIFSHQGESLLDVYESEPGVKDKTVNQIRADFDRQMASQVDRLLKRRKAG